MTTQHTPGPWFAVHNNCYWEIRSDRGDYTGEQIGDACASKFIGGQADNPIADANACLIAAAPELLEALRNLELGANTVNACYTRNPANFAAALRDLADYADQARSAITKATGGAA